jgi:hypothetical protein
MTITRTAASAMFVTDGLATDFPFEFALAAGDDLVVQLISAESIVTTIPETDYTVTITGNESGVVEMNVAPAAGQHLYFYRDTPRTQRVEITKQSSYDPKVVQTVWDKLTMITQELATVIGRAIVAPPGINQTDYFTMLQSYVTSAGADAMVAQAAAAAAAESAAEALAKENSMLRWRGVWANNTDYAPSDIVFTGGSSYICTTAHNSGVVDGWTLGYWALFAQQGLAGSGSGDMLKADNLAGLANPAAARGNLGLSSLATLNPSSTPAANRVLYGDRWDTLPAQQFIPLDPIAGGTMRFDQTPWLGINNMITVALSITAWGKRGTNDNNPVPRPRAGYQVSYDNGASWSSVYYPLPDAETGGAVGITSQTVNISIWLNGINAIRLASITAPSMGTGGQFGMMSRIA